MKKRTSLHENEPYLSNLLKPKQFTYNTVRYQQSDAGVNTCGSHVVHRLYRLKKQNMDLDQNHSFMLSIKEDFNMTFDMIVAEFIKTNFNLHDIA